MPLRTKAILPQVWRYARSDGTWSVSKTILSASSENYELFAGQYVIGLHTVNVGGAEQERWFPLMDLLEGSERILHGAAPEQAKTLPGAPCGPIGMRPRRSSLAKVRSQRPYCMDRPWIKEDGSSSRAPFLKRPSFGANAVP
jgi:hypothetical protein